MMLIIIIIMRNNNKWYHVIKVLCLQHRIFGIASIIIDAFLIAFVYGFNEGLQPPNKLSWEYCLALK